MSAETPPVQKTAAVVVIFHPDYPLLVNTVHSLADQVGCVIVVDNTPGAAGECVERLAAELHLAGKLQYIPLHKNYGIGYAQNRGIEHARQMGYVHVMLSDQDTEFPADCVAVLLRTHAELARKGERVAAVAPAHANAFASDVPPFFLGLGTFWRDYVRAPSGVHEISGAIASGKLINMECVGDVGLMNEPLFIDWVDYEWCWRARSKGWKVFGVFDVTLHHHLGDRVVRALDKAIPVHSPLRNYYITRNGVYLCLRGSVLPWLPRLGVGYRTLKTAAATVLLCSPRFGNLQMVLRGLWDGLLGVLGEKASRKPTT